MREPVEFRERRPVRRGDEWYEIFIHVSALLGWFFFGLSFMWIFLIL